MLSRSNADDSAKMAYVTSKNLARRRCVRRGFYERIRSSPIAYLRTEETTLGVRESETPRLRYEVALELLRGRQRRLLRRA